MIVPEPQVHDPLFKPEKLSDGVCALNRGKLRTHSSMELPSCAWRLTFRVSSVDAWGTTAGIVKLLLPPRQSRGNSQDIRRSSSSTTIGTDMEPGELRRI